MNFFEQELAKYERRIKRITENPVPGKLKCNRFLYELWRDCRIRQLEALGGSKPVVYLSMEAPARLFSAMGFQVVHLLMTADRLAAEAPGYISLARRAGYPDFVCGRLLVAAGLLMSGDLPKPDLIVTDSGVCSTGPLVGILASHYLDVPMFTIDSPLDNSEAAIKYLAEQLKEAIDFCEKRIYGIKYDERQLIEAQKRFAQIQDYERRIAELKKNVPCPLAGQDSLRVPPYVELDDPRVIEYYQMLQHELEERVATSKGVIHREVLRAYWLVSAPFYRDVFSFVESRGVTVPLYEESSSIAFRRYGDETQYGRHLSPIEEEAALMAGIIWAGDAERRVRDIIENCVEFKIDLLIHFQQVGCGPNLGTAQIVSERADKELGIPSFFVEGCCLDAEKFDEQEFQTQLEEFIGALLSRKHKI